MFCGPLAAQTSRAKAPPILMRPRTMKKILIPVTNHGTLGDTDEANGTYAPELTHALHVFIEAGIDYDISSIAGGKAPLYGEDTPDDEINETILANEELQRKLTATIPVSSVDIDQYDAIFYPGGFGLLSDLASNQDFAALSASKYEQGGIIGAVCHGPAALLPIKLSNGKMLLADKSVTCFTREEELDFGTIDKIPFLLEESLTRVAGKYTKAQPWQSLVIDDGRLITGQNPASAAAVAQKMVEALG